MRKCGDAEMWGCGECGGRGTEGMGVGACELQGDWDRGFPGGLVHAGCRESVLECRGFVLWASAEQEGAGWDPGGRGAWGTGNGGVHGHRDCGTRGA